MKIWHVLHGFAPEMSGGTERTVEAIARAMVDLGHDVTVVCGSIEPASSARVDDFRHDGIRVLRLHRDDFHYEDWHKSRSDALGGQFSARLECARPDVVHVHHWIRMTSDLARRARRSGAVVAVTLHDYFTTYAKATRRYDDTEPAAPESPRLVDVRERNDAFARHRADFAAELACAHRRYAPSQAHADGLSASLGEDVGTIEVMRPPLLRRLDRVPGDAHRGRKLLVWGSLYPEKGIDLALDAVVSIGGGWTLEIRGEAHDPEYRDRLATRVANLPAVELTGAFLPQDLESTDADYALLPSLCAESYGLTLDEARDLRLPVIAADLPAYREHADLAATAFFAAGDAGDLARVLADQERLAALPAAAPIGSALGPRDAAQALLADYVRASST